MIIGIGTDILEIKRIGKILNKHDKKFIKRIYGSNEISVIENKKNNLDHYLSKRFAAKEATWKAFNPKRGKGLIFKEIETIFSFSTSIHLPLGVNLLAFSHKFKEIWVHL